MVVNQVQFQSGLSMARSIQRYGIEAKCYRALYRARWPQGFCCPKCQSCPRSRFRRAVRICCQYRACRQQATLTSGTVFDGSKLPLTTWFLAMHLLTGSKTNMAALELKRHLGVCYDTARKLKHKVIQVMIEREESYQLGGFVQIDEAYLGGERNGGNPRRGSENKQPFVLAVATDEALEHLTFAVIEPVRSFDNASLTDWGRRRLAPDAESSATGWVASAVSWSWITRTPCWEAGGCRVATEVTGARWVNVMLGNVKRTISGCYHAMRQAKYARHYLAEAAYRFNRRFHLAELMPRLASAMTLCKPWSEPKLRAAYNFHG